MYVVAHRPDAALALAESMMAGAVEQGSPSRNALALVGRGVTLLDLGDLPKRGGRS